MIKPTPTPHTAPPPSKERRIADDAPLLSHREYDGMDDFAKSLLEGYRVIRERMAAGGEGWTPKL
jgi:hypothetical protein